MTDSLIRELTGRLARIEDERAIIATLYAYGTALDYGDRDLFMDCFTRDASYVVAMRLEAQAGFEFHGHDELRGYFDNHTHAPAAYHKHVTVNPTISIDGDEASASSYFLRVDSGQASAPAIVFASGRYVDRLTRDGGGRWRIQSRLCEVENI
jgi:3-phenylpropionate/cinnamic acid dioxygenase small subunit